MVVELEFLVGLLNNPASTSKEAGIEHIINPVVKLPEISWM